MMNSSSMSIDYGITLIQFVDVENHNEQNLLHVPQLLANLRTALGGARELHKYIYHNPNDPTLGERYLLKITKLLKAQNDTSASLQSFMKECPHIEE